MLALHSRIIRSPALLTAEIDGELVMMDVESGSYFNLDLIGTDIWNRIADPVDIDSLCLELSGRYDASIDIIRRDVLALLDQMVAKGLVKVQA